MTNGSATPGETPSGAAARIIKGVLLLGRGDATGILMFRSEPEAVLSALAPSAALFLVLTIALLVQGYTAIGLTKLLLLVVSLLVSLVVSQLAAEFWKRETCWMRYATAALWTGWLPVLVSLFAMALVQVVMPGAAGSKTTMMGVMAIVEVYGLWLAWFVARSGLQIGGGKAALLIVLVRAVSVALYGLAAILPPHYHVIRELMAPLPQS